MIIGIHSEQYDGRGSGKVPYDYGVALEEIYGHTPVFITSKHSINDGLPKIQSRFKTILYDETNSHDIRNTLSHIVDDVRLDFLYMLKSGQDDGKTPTNCRTGVHCVFLMNSPHGNVYAGVSEYIALKFGKKLYVPHIIKNYAASKNIREELNIPKDALVVGRAGGFDTFNVDFVKTGIETVLDHRPDIYFLFLNTKEFYKHERLIHMPWVKSEQDKFNMIHACDVMIHARHGGESFGLACGEFSVANKPIITWSGLNDSCGEGHDKNHLSILGDKALIYNNQQDVVDLLFNIDKQFINSVDWDMYSEKFGENIVINKFNEVFLKNDY